MSQAKRKLNRLKDYDYSQNGAYFVTVCTRRHENLLGCITDELIPKMQLSELGQLVDMEILRLSRTYPEAAITRFVIMPNHVHMLITVCSDTGRQDAAPTISRLVGQWKRAISIKAGYSTWQKSFHDHIVRDEKDLERVVDYIELNPQRWSDDCYYRSGDGRQDAAPTSRRQDAAPTF